MSCCVHCSLFFLSNNKIKTKVYVGWESKNFVPEGGNNETIVLDNMFIFMWIILSFTLNTFNIKIV